MTSPRHLDPGGIAAIALALGLLNGCESFRGKLYWAGAVPPTAGNSVCRALGPSSAPAVEIIVQDREGGTIPGAAVRVSAPSFASPKNHETDRRGRVRVFAAAGRWTVDVRLRGFRSGRHAFDVATDEECVVTFSLEPERP